MKSIYANGKKNLAQKSTIKAQNKFTKCMVTEIPDSYIPCMVVIQRVTSNFNHGKMCVYAYSVSWKADILSISGLLKALKAVGLVVLKFEDWMWTN